MGLAHPQCLVPQLISFVHLASIHPHTAVDVALLGLELVAVLLLDGCDLDLHILQQVGSELLCQADHVVPLVGVAVHADGLVHFFHFQLELFGFFLAFVIFELLGIFAV